MSYIQYCDILDTVITGVHVGLGCMSEVGAVSDGDSVMSTTDQSTLLTCHEASPLETSSSSL